MLIKCVVVGIGVGTTSIITRCVEDTFSGEHTRSEREPVCAYVLSFLTHQRLKMIYSNKLKNPTRLQIWDYNPKYPGTNNGHLYRGANIILVNSTCDAG